MATHSSSSSMYDVNIIPKQEGIDPIGCPPLLNDFSGYSFWDYPGDLSVQDCLFEAFPTSSPFVDEAPLYPSMDIERISQNVVQECDSFRDFENGFGELNGAITSEEFGLVTNDNVQVDENHSFVYSVEASKVDKNNISVGVIEEKCCVSKTLTREIVSNYFYMPISQAAKELNIGLTLLKKRCRELGIRRWPHRKLMSLETLIKNVQELGKNQGEAKIREAIKVLENERKLLLRSPDLQLDETTKRLRQACFKANYKKRRLVGMMDNSSSSSSSSSNANFSSVPVLDYGSRVDYNDDEEDEEIKSLISDCYPSSNSVFL